MNKPAQYVPHKSLHHLPGSTYKRISLIQTPGTQ